MITSLTYSEIRISWFSIHTVAANIWKNVIAYFPEPLLDVSANDTIVLERERGSNEVKN